jgi:UPF0716 protein FxsA
MTGRPPLNRWLLPVLVAGFIVVSIAEVWLLTVVGGAIGLLPTLLILLAEAVVGAFLLRREGRKSWAALVTAYQEGRVPTGQLADAALVLVGGIMLILPGFFTDIVGLAFLLPPSRPLVRKALGWMVATQASKSGLSLNAVRARYAPGTVPGSVVADDPKPSPGPDPTVISGEIED